MINIQQLRQLNPKIITIGSHQQIIQSMLDFDYLSRKEKPSIIAIWATGRKYERYFFGKKEILIPVFANVEQIPDRIKNSVNLFLNVSSGRRALSSTEEILQTFPNLLGGSIFAEDVPEEHALRLFQIVEKQHKFIVGPASVGVLFPGVLKLGAITGTQAKQLLSSHVVEQGTVAAFAASGGMVNEIVTQVTQFGKRLSFALHFGGDRFPITTPRDAFLAAEEDEQTKTIVYYGELGGEDEYELVKLMNSGKVTKDVIVYVAGTISEIFETPPQFGHAKAIAKTHEESARSKRTALKDAGAQVAETFGEFVGMIKDIESKNTNDSFEKMNYNQNAMDLEDRKHALIASSISKDENGEITVLGENLTSFAKNNSFAFIASSLFLGKKIKSQELEKFVDFVLRLLVDHGPYVSGAVNTIVTARAGRDLESAVASGLLTIGPRFGGAINQAAENWLKGTETHTSSFDFVENFAKEKRYIAGIGHKKYRVDFPDPRVQELLSFTNNLEHKKFTNFALEIEKITASKKGNLILNVDGTIAAVLLDILSEKEEYSTDQLQELVNTEFFNALFVLSRSVGFIAHFLDQKRLDEGIFRLSEEHVADAS